MPIPTLRSTLLTLLGLAAALLWGAAELLAIQRCRWGQRLRSL
jgi:hypothetical protein